MTRALNVTLHMQGDDVTRPVTWSIVNASLVQSRSPWLHFPAISGETDAQVIERNNNEVLLPLVLSASGLRERATPYQETLSINVQSSYVAAARTQRPLAWR